MRYTALFAAPVISFFELWYIALRIILLHPHRVLGACGSCTFSTVSHWPPIGRGWKQDSSGHADLPLQNCLMPLHQKQVGPLIQFTFARKVPGAAIQTSEVNWFRLEDTLIDTGSEPASNELIGCLSEQPPSRIILTHQHEDHVGGVPALLREFGPMPIHVPEQHTAILEKGYPVPDYRRNFWGNMQPIRGAIPYSDGHRFSIGPYRLYAKDTPGHTVGHKTIYFEADRLYVISGDLYLAPRLPNALYETSVPDMIASLQWLLGLGQDFVLLPSHGGPYVDGPRRIHQLLDWYIRQSDEILELHQKFPDADYREIFRIRHGHYNRMEIHSAGELSRLALIRGVLEPVKKLPAAPIELDEELLRESKEKLGLI